MFSLFIALIEVNSLIDSFLLLLFIFKFIALLLLNEEICIDSKLLSDFLFLPNNKLGLDSNFSSFFKLLFSFLLLIDFISSFSFCSISLFKNCSAKLF